MSEHDPHQAGAREDLCRFLSACYYEPAPEFAEDRLFDSMLEAAGRLDPGLALLARQLGEAFAAQDLQTLLVDYARLFLGPVQPLAKPYGSFWLSGDTQLMQDSTMAVLELYEQGGLEIDKDFRELPDHVAVELEFLYLLTFTQNQARQRGDIEALSASQLLQGRFLDQHLGAWIGPFTAAVKAGAQTGFYRALAELTARFVRLMERDANADH